MYFHNCGLFVFSECRMHIIWVLFFINYYSHGYVVYLKQVSEYPLWTHTSFGVMIVSDQDRQTDLLSAIESTYLMVMGIVILMLIFGIITAFHKIQVLK